LSCAESNYRKILRKHLARLLDHQNIYWKKRCTIRWNKFGDENTKFFQSIATKRYTRNYIASLALSDGYVVSSHDEKDEVFFRHTRIGWGQVTNLTYSLISPPSHATRGLEELPAPITKEEIDNIVKTMPIGKALGPDGFNG
jgi:hypothetical protein